MKMHVKSTDHCSSRHTTNVGAVSSHVLLFSLKIHVCVGGGVVESKRDELFSSY